MLNELTRAANTGRPPDDLLARGLELLLGVTKLPAGIACAWAGERALVSATRGLRPAAVRAVDRGFALAMPADTRVFDVSVLPVPRAAREILEAEGIRRGLIVPLRSERGPTGALIGLARGRDPVRVSPALRLIGEQLGGAVGNAQVRQGLQAANADLLRLLTLVKILAEPRSLEDTLTTVAQAARSFARAVTVGVWLADVVTRRLQRIVLLEQGDAWNLEPRRFFAYGDDLVGWVAETGQPGHLHDALHDARVSDRDWARERGITSLYAFPLRFMNRLVGVLSLGTEKPLFDPHLSLLEAYSDHAALAIGQADLRRQLET